MIQLDLLPRQDKQEILHGDCLQVMKGIADNSIDFICTDPPYGLNFMGKAWDSEIPGVEIWKEALRICKPGSMLAAFGGSRTHHHLMMALEQVGWEIRDCIMWITSQGFPKGINIGKHVKEFDGYNTQLKPAYEPIILAMKPLEGTYAQNAEKWGVAGINIEAGRIPTNEDLTRNCLGLASAKNEGWKSPFHEFAQKKVYGSLTGRYPANVILDEEAAQQLDEMTGNLKSTGGQGNYGNNLYGNLNNKEIKKDVGYHDFGGASRFFYCAKASNSERNAGLEGMPLKDLNKIGTFNEPGNNGALKNSAPQANIHPCVKPIALMKYILKLLAPPGNPICLDMFAGSGTTLVAAKQLGINCVGIEKEAEYVEIAKRRVSN